MTAANMQAAAGFFGNVASTNDDLTVAANNRQYVEIVKKFGSVHKEMKQLSDSLREVKENVSNVQMELNAMKESTSEKDPGPVNGVVKSSRLPKVVTVGIAS